MYWLLCVCPETQIFVDKLFEAVGNRSYLPLSEQQTPAIKTDLKLEKDEAKKDEVICIQWDISQIHVVLFSYNFNFQ